LTRLHRFFVPPSQISEGFVRITGPDARQIRTVLRMRKGESIEAIDGTGICYRAEICDVSGTCITAVVCEVWRPNTEPRVHLTLAQGLPKGDKFALVVQKGTELGVSEFVGVLAARSVRRPDDSGLRLARLGRIAKEAAEQCGRAKIPLVWAARSVSEVLERVKDYDLAVVAWEGESARLLSQVVRERAAASRALLFVGPEGGFAQEEVEAARCAGAELVSLGSRILRTETAAIAASAIMLNELEGHL